MTKGKPCPLLHLPWVFLGQPRKAFLGADATLFLGSLLGVIILFRGLLLVKCEPGDSAEAWWQFPNKDKYGHKTIPFRGEKKAN